MSDWQTFPFSDFAGLDLNSAPDSSACIDMLNCDLDKRGAVRSRDGFVDFTAATAADPYLNVHVRLDGDVLASRLQVVAGLTSAGAVTATQATGAPAQSYADIGTPTATYTYFGSVSSSDTLRRWDGSAFATPAGNPAARFVAVQPNDNRLVAAGVTALPSGSSAAAASEHLVHFSDPGAPDTWGADNWVLLTPGDGGVITGAVTWREYTFVFKQRKFFVFYGNSVDSTGGAVFNYRAVDTGIGAIGSSGWAQCVAVAPDAVYFIGNDGRIYRTTGGPPVSVSLPVDPAITDTQHSFSQVTSVLTDSGSLSYQGLAYADGRIIATYNASMADPDPHQLVYDIAGNYWLHWNLPAFGFGANTVNTGQRYPIYFANSTLSPDDGEVSRVDREATTDDGSAIVSRYRTGFYDLGVDDEKRTRQMTVWGTGAPSLKMSRDFASLDTARSLTLGTSPATDRATIACSKDGVLLSHEFSASSGAWRVHRAVIEFMPKRSAGAKTP